MATTKQDEGGPTVSERVTFRLSKQDLQRVDQFIEQTDEYSNRSGFLRDAALRLIDNSTEQP